MEITKNQSKILQTMATLMMLFLHLFNREHIGLFTPLIYVGSQPLSYYLSLFCDCCVPIFCFVSGYGLYHTYNKNETPYTKNNLRRILKLYINYWLILFIFAICLGFLLNKHGYPGDWMTLFLNILAVDNLYNGAWWFFFTYILLVFSSSIIFRIAKSNYAILLFLFSIGFYLISFYFRIYSPNLFDSLFINWIQRQICLYGCSFFPFLIGALSLKYKWNTKVSLFFNKVKLKNSLALTAIIVLIIIHGLIPNFIVAPFLAIPFILLFNQIKFSNQINKLILKLSVHSTNLWLIHMFFYQVYFKNFIYSAKYVLLIFLLLIGCSFLSSYFINKIYHPILKLKFIK
tara:strand:- start:207 stop:1241 length:1035 start_codon:yes stop_codon:yes gene_type:complete